VWDFKSEINHVRFATTKDNFRKALPFIIVVLIVVEFYTDTLTPRGFSDWVLYIVPIILSGWMRKPWTRTVTTVVSILSVIGFFLSPQGAIPHQFSTGIINRMLGIVTYWIAAILIILRKGALERLQRVHHELEIATKKSLEAERLKTQFLADTSHELRTPLALVKSHIDLALGKKSRSKTSPYFALKQIDATIKNMSQIIADLTSLTKSDLRFQPSLMLKAVSLNKLLEGTVKKLALLARSKRIKTIKRFSKKDIIYYQGDMEQLERLFINLLANAIQYGRRGGWVAITLSQDTRRVMIEIKDNGIGIPEENIPYIFERFYRVEKTRNRSVGGVGLGLAICKWIVENHGGTIEIVSIPGKGSTFIVKLPSSPLRTKKITARLNAKR